MRKNNINLLTFPFCHSLLFAFSMDCHAHHKRRYAYVIHKLMKTSDKLINSWIKHPISILLTHFKLKYWWDKHAYYIKLFLVVWSFFKSTP